MIVFGLSTFFNHIKYNDTIWCIFSIILVLSPDGKDAIPLAMSRIKANLLGAIVGFIIILFFPHHPSAWILSFALVLTIGIAYIIKLKDAIRSALCATIIIILPSSGIQSLMSPMERVLSVVAGCILGIIITVIFHFKTHSDQLKEKIIKK